ncbi:MAG: M43 family zinc metalloprotease [Cyclobacteriaceae bacterium]
MLLRFTIFTFSLLIAASSLAQERCGTVEYEKMLHQKNPKKETIDQFEKWMNNKLNLLKNAPASTSGAQRTQTTYTIPVVVHVIHNGEAIGTGINISDAQVLSQIKVLNDDFNRLNADKTNTPSVFQSVAGSFDVQFVLAQQDPNGLATNGIVRVKGSQSSWTFGNNYLLKSQSYWPAEQYLNVWVTYLTDYLGYTQLPVSSTLPGLEDSSNERLTDGIVINYREFGTIEAGSFDLHPKYNKGRTLTHEMGHFFGLRHVWGDGSDCTSTDYVADTPTQSNSSAGCPTHPQTNCTTAKMFQNYLDYSDDACMNIFTQGQVARMNTIIQNSPRRVELPNSPGSQPPTSVANDLGIKTALSPAATACSGFIVPSIAVRNYGTNAITSAQIQFKKNGRIVETKGISSPLSISAEQQIDFTPILLSNSTSYSFEFSILSTNSGTDGNANNNLKSITTATPSLGTLPLVESFSPFPSTWSIDNPDGLMKWAANSSSGRPSMYIDFYNYTELGAIDKLETPLLDLTTATSATLIFDRAYATYPGVTGERLRVLASTACRFDNSPVVLFDKSDDNLKTAPPTTSAFVPASTQWVTEVIPLTQFLGQSVQLAFEGTNANGNNLYISNVKVITGTFLDLALSTLESPSPVSCQSNPSPSIRVKNNGNVPVTSFTVSTTFNGGSVQNQIFSNVSIGLNVDQVFQLNSISLAVGINQYTVSLSNPNGAVDVNSQNNSGSYNFIFNNARDIIPLRERFDSNTQLNWTIVSQGQQQLWTKASTNYSNSLFYNSFTNTNIGDESWLVSPVLDLTNTSKASLFFDVSYSKSTKGNEELRTLVSTDCGLTFKDIIFDQSGNLLSIKDSQDPWKPTLTTDWKNNFINLNDYIGQSNVRFAFVATNGNGNNLYLDNIDFYTDDSPIQVSTKPLTNSVNVYSGNGIGSALSLTFNLEERQPTRVTIFNSIGQEVADQSFPDALNQTFSIDVGERASGIYILRLQVGSQLSAKKVFIGN